MVSEGGRLGTGLRVTSETPQNAPGAPYSIPVPEQKVSLVTPLPARGDEAPAAQRPWKETRPWRAGGHRALRVPGRAPRGTRRPVFPERAGDAAPRGRVSGAFGCEGDSL